MSAPLMVKGKARRSKPAGDREQRERRGDLAEVEGGERRADQVRRPAAVRWPGRNALQGEINAVHAPKKDSKLLDQLVTEVRPPIVPSSPARRKPPAAARAPAPGSGSRSSPAECPRSQMPSAKNRPREAGRAALGDHRQRFADQQPVGVDRRAEGHPFRQPLANQRR